MPADGAFSFTPGVADRASTGFVRPRHPRLYCGLLAACRLIFAALGFRMELRGAGNLPADERGRHAGGWIAAAVPHCTWIEPFVLALLLPAEPRLVFLGDARTMARSPVRRALLRLIGGVVPIGIDHGPAAFAAHVAAARAVLASGAVFALFPEVGPPSTPGTARPLSAGVGYIALRTGAPIVPMALGGTRELYLRRRIVLDVLPAVDPAALAGLDPEADLPAPGSSEERAAAHAIAATLHARTGPAVERAWRDAEPPPGARRRWRWLTGILH